MTLGLIDPKKQVLQKPLNFICILAQIPILSKNISRKTTERTDSNMSVVCFDNIMYMNQSKAKNILAFWIMDWCLSF